MSVTGKMSILFLFFVQVNLLNSIHDNFEQ